MSTRGLACLLFFLLPVLASCYQRIEKPRLEVITAELTAPEGSYPLHLRTTGECRVFPLTFVGGSESVGVAISVLDPCETLVLGRLSSNGAYVIGTDSTYSVLEESYYQRSSEPRIPLRISPQPTHVGYPFFDLEVPEALANLPLLSAGGELVSGTVPLVRAQENEIHRVHVTFLADGMPYAIDIAFRLGIDVTWLASPPGVVP